MASSWSREIKLPEKCPCCPALCKRTFDDIGLFQHAIAIIKNNANPETVLAHSVLLNNLNGKLTNIATTRDQSPLLHRSSMNIMDSQPQKTAIPMPMTSDLPDKSTARDQDVEKIVWPWTGILMNINHEQIARNGKNNCQASNGKAITNSSPWNIDLNSYFSYLNPRGVQALWNQGLVVLDFGQDLLGYFDAQDFEKGFAQCKRGKLDFENMIKHRKERVQEMFGWIADENDFNRMNAVGEFLRKRRALRAKPRFCEAWTEHHDMLLQDVQSKLREKNMKLMELGKEVCNLQTKVYQAENKKYSAEALFLLKESKHRQELNEKTNKLLKSHNDELVREREKINSLQAELKESQKKCQHLEEKNTQSTSNETLIPKLIDLVEEKEGLQDTVEKLIYKEREINDKFQSAMEAAKEVLQENTKPIGIKKVGLMNEGPWKKAFAQKFKDHKEGWETPCASSVSLWNEDYLRDPSWFPYKVVATKGGKFEEHIDTNDERLAKLSRDFGAEVFKTVVDALNELKEFNASGRYPISIPWNFERGRAAGLDEIIKYLASDRSKKRKTALE